MRLKYLTIILILLINSLDAQDLFDPITKSKINFTQINSDFGPRDINNGSKFHKGIDYQLTAFNYAYSIEPGNITKIRFKKSNIDYIVINKKWRYMHMPSQNSNYTWEIIDNSGEDCDFIVIRYINDNQLKTLKVLGSTNCNKTTYFDLRTDKEYPIKKKGRIR